MSVNLQELYPDLYEGHIFVKRQNNTSQVIHLLSNNDSTHTLHLAVKESNAGIDRTDTLELIADVQQKACGITRPFWSTLLEKCICLPKPQKFLYYNMKCEQYDLTGFSLPVVFIDSTISMSAPLTEALSYNTRFIDVLFLKTNTTRFKSMVIPPGVHINSVFAAKEVVIPFDAVLKNCEIYADRIIFRENSTKRMIAVAEKSDNGEWYLSEVKPQVMLKSFSKVHEICDSVDGKTSLYYQRVLQGVKFYNVRAYQTHSQTLSEGIDTFFVEPVKKKEADTQSASGNKSLLFSGLAGSVYLNAKWGVSTEDTREIRFIDTALSGTISLAGSSVKAHIEDSVLRNMYVAALTNQDKSLTVARSKIEHSYLFINMGVSFEGSVHIEGSYVAVGEHVQLSALRRITVSGSIIKKLPAISTSTTCKIENSVVAIDMTGEELLSRLDRNISVSNSIIYTSDNKVIRF